MPTPIPRELTDFLFSTTSVRIPHLLQHLKGVPKFYRFISERYPLISTPLYPSAAPQIDNLYLDMNGIIHNCVRTVPGNGGLETSRYSTSVPPTTKSHQQIFLDVFKYIDNLLTLITPRRVLYMAIDGVAPRAKMNQQRARRFRSAKERLDEHTRMTAEDPMYAAAEVEPFDSNCITPGTHFMYKLSEALKYFVTKKLTEDINWADIQVILSGAESPGEGEHKIMEYIRSMRECGQFPPNTRHCVYGLDADLIMLGLVTHEPHFFVLREKVDFNYWRKKGGPRVAATLDTTVFGEFELLSIGLLREYLVLELGADGNCDLPYFDVERIADDFVFILMLVGNDFLPHLPTLNIADGTLHVMLHLYKRVLPLLGGYLTHAGTICGDHLEYFFAKLGLLEEDILRQRLQDEASGSERRNRRGQRGKAFANVDLDQLFGMSSSSDHSKPLSSEELRSESLLCRENVKKIEALKNDYYTEKFGLESVDDSSLKRITDAYLEGVAWTLKYYTEGCRQWRWFYPEHYAPLASDVTGIVETLKRYEKSIVADRPFRPFEQLMSVLPPVSSWCLPSPYQDLMIRPTSPIRDLYPEDFRTDMNGKRNDWEAVVLLPFVDESRLLDALGVIPSKALSREEVLRNELGPSYVYSKDTNSKEVMQSPFGMRMPSFVHQTKRTKLVLPYIASGKAFTPALLPGTKAAKSGKDYADLPTLNEVEHRSRLEAIGVNVFGTPSKSDSLVLVIDFNLSHEDKTTTELTSSRSQDSILDERGITVGSSVWCGYPWRVPASVDSIMNELVTKQILRPSQGTSDQINTPRIEARKTKRDNFARDVNVVTSSLLQRYAVSVSTPKQVVAVRQVEDSTKFSPANKKNEITLYHDRFLTLRSANREQRFASGAPKQLVQGMTVLYVGHGCYFGHRGSVMSRGANGMVRIRFNRCGAAAKEPAFGYRVVSVCGSQERWMPLSKFAATVGLRVPIVDQFLGSLRVRLSSGKDEVDLGLGVKYIGRGLYVPGYARPDDRSHFLFSRKCADLLLDYSKAFPSLFTVIGKMKAEGVRNGGRTRGVVIFEGKDLFPDAKKPDEAVRAVSTWMSMQDIASLPLVSTNADILTREVVSELEKHCSIALELQREFDEFSRKANRGVVVKEVDQDTLLTGHEALEWNIDGRKSSTGIYRAPVKADASDLRLGDRVVNRKGSGGLPFGLRGTVIGIHPPKVPEESDEDESDDEMSSQALVEVVFDEGFISGGSLGNRCSKGRGKVVPASSLIIIRPDRDNTFYVQNYARVAARVGLGFKQSSEKNGYNSGKSDVIADAAVRTYAAAVKKRSAPISKEPVAGAGKNLSLTGAVRGAACDGSSEGARGISDSFFSARPETLPLPSFLRSRPPSHDRHDNREIGTARGLSKNQHDATLQVRPGDVQRGGGKSDMNGGMASDASVVEKQLKGALEKRENSDGRGKEATGSGADMQTEGTDEDEFAAIWRKLQTSSEKQ